MPLPPDIETRALALQAAVTALGESAVGYGDLGAMDKPGTSLRNLTWVFVQYIRTGHWTEAHGSDWTRRDEEEDGW